MHPHHLPTCIGDIDGTTPHWMVGVMPCLTRGRRVNLNETLYFFGMSPRDINYKGIISPKQLQTLCGNSCSLNGLERILFEAIQSTDICTGTTLQGRR